uniref:Pre-mRNA-splicing factor 38 n=1 Tax=Phlebotomus kandelakii TaxID=1109342 RepID=A0A6B2EE69_9DIPT
MANRTVKDAKNVHGTNPQYLVEKIIRSRIYDSKYWKEQCFALTAELLVDKAMELRYIGGVYGGNIKPTPFLCLILKMLQIQPEKDIIVEFIKNEEFKYVRALGAFYLRLTGIAIDCYKYLEPLYNDNRKLRRQNRQSNFEIVHVDEFIDELLRSDRVCDIILPRIQKRHILEENNELEPKISALDDDLDEEMASDEEYFLEKGATNAKSNSDRVKKRSRSRSYSKERKDRRLDRKKDEARQEEDRERERRERDLRKRERDRRIRHERQEIRERDHRRNYYKAGDRRRP